MKKTFLLAGFASMLFACNNNSDNNVNKTGTSDHADHNTHSNDATPTTNGNAIKGTMDKMMQDMHGMKATGNNDIDFATMMIAHHKGAVEMSKVEIDKGNNAELKNFAQTVINDQNKEITLMEEAIATSPKTASPNATDFQKAMNASMMVMMKDTTVIYNHIDKDFAAQMIPHHQSAVDMAKAYLEYGKEPRLITLSQNIINAQTKEINWLKQWLANNKE